MKKNGILIASLLVAALVLFLYLLSKPLLPLERPLRTPEINPLPGVNPSTPSPSPVIPTSSPDISSSPSPSATPASPPRTHRIIMDAKGFTPSSLVTRVGDTVIFENNDTRERWPASDLHPTHLLCLGFDSQGGVKPGGTYTYTFPEARTCTLHDHLFPKFTGSITVEP